MAFELAGQLPRRLTAEDGGMPNGDETKVESREAKQGSRTAQCDNKGSFSFSAPCCWWRSLVGLGLWAGAASSSDFCEDG